jgi:hypothetical protein
MAGEKAPGKGRRIGNDDCTLTADHYGDPDKGAQARRRYREPRDGYGEIKRGGFLPLYWNENYFRLLRTDSSIGNVLASAGKTPILTSLLYSVMAFLIISASLAYCLACLGTNPEVRPRTS